MSTKTGIEWTEATWNPVRGCSRVSAGCDHCYAEGIAARFSGPGQPFDGFAKRVHGKPHWTGRVELVPEKLDDPLRWKKPRRVFVNSMSDLFHEGLPATAIDRVFAVMALCPQHTFQVLTKRPERMRAYMNDLETPHRVLAQAGIATGAESREERVARWPLPNVWLGVSAEDQATADERIPHLLATPAARRFVSLEPLLGAIRLDRVCLHPQKPGSHKAGIHLDTLAGSYYESGIAYTGDWDITGEPPPDTERRRLDWVIVGGESGPGARPMHTDWARSVRDQCAAAGVAYFFKQWGAWSPHVRASDAAPSRTQAWVAPDGKFIVDGDDGRCEGPGWIPMKRVGKKAAGALLDGREHLEVPER